MPLLRRGRGIREAHGGQRLGRGVAILEILKNRASEWVPALRWNTSEEFAIPFDDKVAEAAFDICFRLK